MTRARKSLALALFSNMGNQRKIAEISLNF